MITKTTVVPFPESGDPGSGDDDVSRMVESIRRGSAEASEDAMEELYARVCRAAAPYFRCQLGT